MISFSLDGNIQSEATIAPDGADARIVARMRLLLAISATLSVFVDHVDSGGVSTSQWLVFAGYLIHSLVICGFAQSERRFYQNRLFHWLDLFWFGLIILFTDGSRSLYFLFFFFAILTASFRWGYKEGARVTLASAAIFTVCAMSPISVDELSRLFLRCSFLLGLGYLSSYWGGSKVELQRRLTLLRDVSRLSNPRFGVGRTIATVLEKTLAFFEGGGCMLLLRDRETNEYSLRTIRQDGEKHPVETTSIGAAAALPLLALPRDQIVVHRGRTTSVLNISDISDDERRPRRERPLWRKESGSVCQRIADLLNARSFISAPLSLRNSEGRIYVCSQGKASFDRSDAMFLSYITAQAFPVIENIELLDRMVSEAALQERQKIALDLHDTAIQPYIGLKLGLAALRKKSADSNPLIGDIEKLQDMADKVIDDLRRYAGDVRNSVAINEQILLKVLERQSARLREFYGVDIEVRVEGDLKVDDRLTAEVMQIVREGMSNICKHSTAERGLVLLKCVGGRLRISIENESRDDADRPEFLPRSIADRVKTLGGSTRVGRGMDGCTAVHVEIPI